MSTTAAGGHSRLITLADYAGMLGRDALAELAAARLIATIEPTHVDAVEQAGFVLGQEPRAGEQLRRGQMVILYIGDHPDAILAPPRPRRRPHSKQGPTLFDDSVGSEAPATPDAHVSSVSPAPADAVGPFPFPERPRPAWPIDSVPDAQSTTPAADTDGALAAQVRLRAGHSRPPASVEPERVPAPEPYPEDIPDVQLAEPEASGDDLSEILEPDQVSEAAALERRDASPRARRQRPQRHVARLSGRQKLAASLSALVILYLAATLLGSRPAHRAIPTARVTYVAIPAHAAGIPPSSTTQPSTATTTAPTPATRRPADHHVHVRRLAPTTHTSIPATPPTSTPTVTSTPVTPAPPVSSPALAEPASSPALAPTSAPARPVTQAPSASSSSPHVSPIGPIAPAPNQP